MSQVLIRKAMEKRLAAISAPLATAYENDAYAPVNGTPYQRANLIPATPDDAIRGSATYFELGVFQITLLYPLNAGNRAAATQAELVRTHFKKGTTLVEGAIQVLVTRVPHIAPGFVEGDRWTVPVSVTYQSQITT